MMMARRTVCCVLILLCSVSCPRAHGQGKFPLRHQVIKDRKSNPFPRELGQLIGKDDKTWVGMPKKLSPKKAVTFTARVAGEETVLLLSLDSNPKLYVDFDRDLDFADEKPILGWAADGDRCYGPLAVPVAGSDGKLAARIVVRVLTRHDSPPYIHLTYAGYRTGLIGLGGSTYRIALLDANFNGRYDDVCVAFDGSYRKADFDCFAMDLDGDARFDRVKEFWPLSKMLIVRGVVYRLEVAPDGSEIQIEEVKGKLKMGWLDVGSRDVEMVLFSPDVGLITLPRSEGKWALPACKHTVVLSHLVRPGQHGTTWELAGRVSGKDRRSYVIPQGETVLARMGLPLRVVQTVNIGARSRTVTIGFSIVGQGGEPYAKVALRDGQAAQPPALRILDEHGRTLHSGLFGRGRHSSPTYTWHVPKGFKGTFRVEIKPSLGPFEYESEWEWYTVK